MPPSKPLDCLHGTEAEVNALAAKLDRLVAEAEARLAHPSPAAPRDHSARVDRAAEQLAREVRAIEASAASPARNASSTEVAAKVETAIEAMTRALEPIRDRRTELEADVGEWRERAEAAVLEGDDGRASHALRGRAAAAAAAEALHAELQARDEAITQWRKLAARLRGGTGEP
ncbi:MAG: hypothetical protein WKG00_37925 [Polyangiaceae bacterium]